jgi:hypothetical protein
LRQRRRPATANRKAGLVPARFPTLVTTVTGNAWVARITNIGQITGDVHV